MGLVSFIAEKFSSARGVHKADGEIYDFKMKALNGEEIDFERYRGKKLLLVNTASRCGYTPQYADLQKLHEQYGDKVVVLGFPSNSFLWQEPGGAEEISSFCQKNYGVSFQLFDKISVKGKNKHPLYRWLEGKTGRVPSWNFCKYLVDETGEQVTFFSSDVSPLDPEILQLINA